MSSESRRDEELLREALAPATDCPSTEDLGLYLDERGDPVWRGALQSHLSLCAHCRTELHLLQEFESGEVSAQEAAAVHAVAEQLTRRSSEIFSHREVAPHRRPWLQEIFARWLSPAAVAFAGILLIFGVGLEMRKSAAPSLHSGSDAGSEVLRSSTLTVLAPVGDLNESPADVKWQPFAGAAKYQVTLFEVDRAPLWRTETTDTHATLDAAVRNRIVPGKTILCEVVALDAAGARIADSGMLRFRVLPRFH